MTTRLQCDECGYTAPDSTPGMQEYAIRRHSCDRHTERQARHQRLQDLLAAGGPEAPCTHNGRHAHGTRNRYVIDKCRCHPCKVASREYETWRRRNAAYGIPAYVPAGPARSHVFRLQQQGMGPKRIAKAASISHGAMAKLLYGDKQRGMRPSRRIRRTTEEQILAVALDLAPGVAVPGIGTRRRLQALVWNGYSVSWLARQLGWTSANFHRLIHGDTDVQVRTAQAATDLYDQYWNTPNPATRGAALAAATRARNYAKQQGWVSALAWDDDTIDTPTGFPQTTARGVDPGDVDEQAITRAILHPGSVRLTKAERLVIIRRLADRGRPDQYIAARAGVTVRTVLRVRQAEHIESRWTA